MAEKGKGKKIRFQGGTIFPLVVTIVLVLGFVLIMYSRSSTKALAVPPQASKGDHWHVAFGIYNCTDWAPNLTGNKENVNGAPDPEFQALGIHSHDDGVIHYHPSSAASSGHNARLARFLQVYDVKLTNTKLTLPADQGGLVLEEGVTKCKDKAGKEVDGQLRLAVWDDATVPGKFRILTSDMAQARITQNGMAMAIFFTPEGTEITMPPSAAQLSKLGSSDSVSATTVAGSATTVAGGASATTTAGSATTVAGSATTTAGSASSATTAAVASSSATTTASSATTSGAASSTTSG